MTGADAFFRIHQDLPREGPGEAGDVTWAAGIAGLRPDAAICDAGCGPGADLPALLKAAPEGHVTAIDSHPGFAAAARARALPRVTVREGDMTRPGGPYDFIWSAGALYFLGVTRGLRLWRDALAPGGAVAFSEVCWRVPDPPAPARDFWSAYPEMTDADGLAARISEAGYETLASRFLSEVAWEGYYRPLEARLDALADDPSDEVRAAIDAHRTEIDVWRRHGASFGYLLSVVRPA